MAEERQVAVAATFDFPLVTWGSTNANFTTSVTFADGDVQLSQDGGAFFTITNTTEVNIGNGIYSVTLTSTEMTMARGALTIIDQSGIKVWEDQVLLITTYGSTVALHAFNRNSTLIEVNLIQWRGESPSTLGVANYVSVNLEAWRGSVPLALSNSLVRAQTDSFAGILTSAAFAPGAITSTAFAAGAINSTAVATNAFTAEKFAADALTTGNVADGLITAISEEVWAQSTRSITAVTAGGITSTSFGAGAINSTAIAAAALIAEKFGVGFLTSTGFAAGAINSTAIADSAITAGKIATDALTTDGIADGVFDRIDSGVNTQVLDVLTVDTFTEPITTTDAPPVSNTIGNKLGYLYGTYRNRLDVSTSAKTFYTSTGGVAFTKAISDTGNYFELGASTA